MRRVLFSFLVVSIMRSQVPVDFKAGRFFDGYTEKRNGVEIEIRYVRDNPRCRHFENCSWMVLWSANKRAREAVIEVTLAGMDFPAVRAWVPGGKETPRVPRDRHNPIFSGEATVVDGREVSAAPLQSVTQIEIRLVNGEREIQSAVFVGEQRKAGVSKP